jgi:hypothetical protein
VPDPIEALDADLTRVAERLRHLVTVRLSAPLGDGGGSAADAGHALAQQLADLDAALHGLPARAVPRLADAAAP